MKVLLLGLGRANLAVAQYLLKREDEVFLYEDNIHMLSEKARSLIDRGQIAMHHDGDYDVVISSPGFPIDKPIIQTMNAKHTPIIDEVEFTYRELKNPSVIAVTGTNGKSTTTALISSILTVANIEHFLGGNIAPGTPFSHALFKPVYQYYVLEISSFQLMRVRQFHPKISVLTNIAVDHLNWHRDFEEYRKAKGRIFSNQYENDFAVLNFEDDMVRRFVRDIRAHVVFFGFGAHQGVWFNSNFYYAGEQLFSSTTLPLTGRHNIMNAAAAIVVAKILAIDNETIEKGIQTFKALPHRLEHIGVIDGISYINNSMCTNESAAIASFRAVPGPKIVIVGGRHKGSEGQRYLDLLTREAKACVLLGENAPFIEAYFKSKSFTNYSVARDMNDAIAKARAFAVSGDTIFLNPGFSSFDYFRDFEERGEVFRHAAYRN
jgi:UDP-N-acetylmuramoylalanine--D-glutamate ligase